jgi:polysaccharide biosynthesis transport protein
LQEEVNTKAKMDAIHAAVKQGRPVIAESDSHSLAVLIAEAEKLRSKLSDLRSRFTEDYIRFNPSLRSLPEQLAKLDAQIAEEKQAGGALAVAMAEDSYAAAHQAVIDIQQQLRTHKQTVVEYTSQFEKHQALQHELETLAGMQQETQQRLADIEVKHRESIPQVEVVDAATLAGKAISPDYTMESALAVPVCLLLGLFAVWIAEYLQHETPTSPQSTESVPLAYITPILRQALGDYQQPQQTLNSTQAVKTLTSSFAGRELSYAEISALFLAAELTTQVIIALLLNGLSGTEILSLHSNHIDPDNSRLTIPLTARTVRLTVCTHALCAHTRWTLDLSSLDEIDALLGCAAIDAGLFMPEEITCENISFSYCLFLIRQGIKLADLPKIIGPVKPERLLQLGKFSPESAGLALEQIDLNYLK